MQTFTCCCVRPDNCRVWNIFQLFGTVSKVTRWVIDNAGLIQPGGVTIEWYFCSIFYVFESWYNALIAQFVCLLTSPLALVILSIFFKLLLATSPLVWPPHLRWSLRWNLYRHLDLTLRRSLAEANLPLPSTPLQPPSESEEINHLCKAASAKKSTDYDIIFCLSHKKNKWNFKRLALQMHSWNMKIPASKKYTYYITRKDVITDLSYIEVYCSKRWDLRRLAPVQRPKSPPKAAIRSSIE